MGMLKIEGQIERVNGKELSYADFVENYMAKNEPVVITGLMDDWKACKDWVTSDGKPNLDFISKHFGKSRVQVADCNTQEFTDQKRLEMTVSECIETWIENSTQKGGNSSTHGTQCKSVLYLKDWHFVKEYPEYVAYTTPMFFHDDWLNLYLDNYRMHMDPDIYQNSDEICSSDYRFVYMGPKGSWTPLHADVFRSYSWSGNVCGKKRWLFLSPSQKHLVFDRYGKNCVYDIDGNVDESKFPGFSTAIWLECIQEKNEIIYVPSGWYHQVQNMEDTISINHNWFNSYSLPWVWDLLLRDYNEAKEYIEDIRDIADDFEGLCQKNLAANTGMNFYDFFIFIARFFFASFVQLCYLLRDIESPILCSSPIARHFASNIKVIRGIALKMTSAEALRESHVSFDTREALKDPLFVKLCTGLGRTYWTLHKEKGSSPDEKGLVDSLRNLNIMKTDICQICTPDELVKFIDDIFPESLGHWQ